MPEAEDLKLKPGSFYMDRAGSVWCCFRVQLFKEEHSRTDCIRINDQRCEYFFLDGRYDRNAVRDLTLVKEITPEEAMKWLEGCYGR